MIAGAYAVLNDVYDLGLTPQAFVVVPRALQPHAGDVLNPTTGVFRLTAHGYQATDSVEFVMIGAGAVPGGGAVNVTLYPAPIDFFRFTLSLTPGGAAMTFSDVGSGAWGIQINPERRLTRHLIDAASRIDECLTAHDPPLLVDPVTLKYPTEIIGMNARMAARSAVPSLMVENAQYRVAIDRLLALEAADEATLAGWREGKPLNPQPTDSNTIPDNAAQATASRCATPWTTGML